MAKVVQYFICKDQLLEINDGHELSDQTKLRNPSKNFAGYRPKLVNPNSRPVEPVSRKLSGPE